ISSLSLHAALPICFGQLAGERLTRHRRTAYSHSIVSCSDRGERVPGPFRDDHHAVGATATQKPVALPHLPLGVAQTHPTRWALPRQVPTLQTTYSAIAVVEGNYEPRVSAVRARQVGQVESIAARVNADSEIRGLLGGQPETTFHILGG